MIIYKSDKYSPYYNLSLEELLLKDDSLTEDIIYFYQHDNAIIIGRNQNTHENINQDYVEEKNIELARRNSGGGSVYHDLGNINFAFISSPKQNNYETFLQPIINFLKSLGLDAKFKGRNDIVIGEFKISGNAQYIYKDKILHHGTLLFDANMEVLSKSLKPNKLKLESKGIKSIHQRVTNIKIQLSNIGIHMNSAQFLDKLINYFVVQGNKLESLPVNKYQKQLYELILFKKSHEWIYNKNPKFDVVNEAKFAGGILKVKYSVEKDKIKNIIFEGDFLSRKNIEDLYYLIIGTEYNKKSFGNILDKIDLINYFGVINKDEILELIFGG